MHTVAVERDGGLRLTERAGRLIVLPRKKTSLDRQLTHLLQRAVVVLTVRQCVGAPRASVLRLPFSTVRQFHLALPPICSSAPAAQARARACDMSINRCCNDVDCVFAHLLSRI